MSFFIHRESILMTLSSFIWDPKINFFLISYIGQSNEYAWQYEGKAIHVRMSAKLFFP